MEPPMSHDELMQCVQSSQQSKIDLLMKRIAALEQGYCYYDAEQERLKKLTPTETYKEIYKDYDWSKIGL